MMSLVIGGSGSGKSAYAEQRITLLSKRYQKYYLATMQLLDCESERKVQRHQKQRSKNNFVTIEQATQIQNALPKMAAGKKTALLECISNLTANEMFIQTEVKQKEQVVNEVIKGVELLKQELQHLVVVSNNVFEDGVVYDETCMEYIRAMGEINTRLAAMAEEVVEVVAGIPILIKQEDQGIK